MRCLKWLGVMGSRLRGNNEGRKNVMCHAAFQKVYPGGLSAHRGIQYSAVDIY
jgi:hypothetical protein